MISKIQAFGEKKMYENIKALSLNEQQESAIKTTEGYVRVVAGAGSGKTRVLTYRYVYLVKELGISPNHILSVTFTNKAATEMKSRINKLIPDEEGGWVCTFHSACKQILNKDIHHLSYPSNFVIIDEDDQKRILDKIFIENGITVRDHNYKECLKSIQFYKTAINPNYVSSLTASDFKADFAGLNLPENDKSSSNFIIKQYLIEERKNWYLDFEDIIRFTLYLFENNKEVLSRWQEYFEYIQVDEFQDVNKQQYELVSILSEKNKNLFIVGDPDQTIYSWRGANVDFFLNFDKVFHPVTTIILDTNYRSTPEILKVGNSLIRYNKHRIEKSLFSVKSSGDKVIYYHAKNQEEECAWISESIEQLHKNGQQYSDIAILYRSSFMTRKIEESLLRKNIPYKVYSGVEFYNRKEIKDALSYLKMLAFEDDISFLRTVNTPARGIGRKRINYLLEYSKQHGVSLYKSMQQCLNNQIFSDTGARQYVDLIETAKEKITLLSIFDLIDYILKESGYDKLLMTQGDQERLDNVNELLDSIKNYVDSAGEAVLLEDYLNNISLITNVDIPNSKDSVKMMTIHTAKGLEFPIVFVCCLNEGLFPSRKIKNMTEMEEERRLAYVAFTRAENALYLSSADGYNATIGGTLLPSRFIFNLNYKENTKALRPLEDAYEQTAIGYIEKSEVELSERKKRELLSSKEWRVGDAVTHKLFGDGIIQQVSPTEIKIKFSDSCTRSILITSPLIIQKAL